MPSSPTCTSASKGRIVKLMAWRRCPASADLFGMAKKKLYGSFFPDPPSRKPYLRSIFYFGQHGEGSRTAPDARPGGGQHLRWAVRRLIAGGAAMLCRTQNAT